jgi:hypothetical protein
MNMEFLYVLPRWEGSTADSHVFENVWRQDFGNQMGTITWLMLGMGTQTPSQRVGL